MEDVKGQNGGDPQQQQQPAPLAELSKPKVRMDYYQNDSDVVVSLYLKGLKKEDVLVEFSDESFRIHASLPGGDKYSNEVHLAKNIKGEASGYKVMGTKVEIRLRKAEGSQWPGLEADDAKGIKEDFKPTYPSSSKCKKDWDKVEKEIEKQEKDDPDSDVNSLFAKIYESGDENTKKAMMKSMQESGGTVLSTNWDEVGKKRVEISPPDGMEFKKWDE